MHRVVAVAHVGAAVLAELDLERDASLIEPPDILADEVLGRVSDIPSVALYGDTLLEMEVDRMIPAAAVFLPLA